MQHNAVAAEFSEYCDEKPNVEIDHKINEQTQNK